MITAAVLTFNEEKHIERCLNSLSWADEILIVDAGSTDRTRELCEAPSRSWSGKTRVVQHAWEGFRTQRNFALDQAQHDWILFVDADESCSPELRERLMGFFANGASPPHRYFKVRRIEFFLGKAIHHGIWNPSYQDRFFHRDGVRYVNDIHEYPAYPQPPRMIHEPLLHSADFAPEKFLEKMNKYTSIEARDRLKQGQRTSAFKIVGAFPAMFLKNYFYYGSYKDGFHGLVISILEGISRAVRHIKMWQYSRPDSSTEGGS